jgi:ABC-2 type transport system ATP-binding protein
VSAIELVEVGAPPATSPLSVTGAVKRWPGSDRRVLDGVDLHLEPGEVISINGRNGTGKTTLLRIAGGLIKPDEGTVRIAGLDPEKQRRACHRILGYVGAGSSALYARLTVDNHLDMWSRLALLPRAERRHAIERTVEQFELEHLRGRRTDRCSMGERQRLRLALGFMHSPDLVLLDEPENSLDDEAIALLARAIDELRARGGAAVVCSPSGVNSAWWVDSRLVLSDGRLEAA